MIEQIVINEFGGPEVLQMQSAELPPPSPGEVRIRHTTIGFNFIDCYQRSGLYPLALPAVPGNEAVGVVEAVGEGVNEVKSGDRIVYRGPAGAYASHRNLPASAAIPIPDGVSDDDAAAIYLKGMTARYLIKDTFEVGAEHTILVYAASGGVGSLLVPWAKHIGAQVIGIVSTETKADLAKEHGCDHVLIDGADDIVAQVHEITAGHGVDVVYDSVGKVTFEQSLDCLKPRGTMVSYGNSSGPVSVPNLGILASKGSLYVTRPILAHFYPDRETETAGADDLFSMIKKNIIKPHIGQTYKLGNIQSLHADAEARKTIGSTLIRP